MGTKTPQPSLFNSFFRVRANPIHRLCWCRAQAYLREKDQKDANESQNSRACLNKEYTGDGTDRWISTSACIETW